MPIRKSINTSSPSDFEPKRKNPISLGSDSNIDNDLKPLKIGGKSTGLEFADGKILSSAEEFVTLKEKTQELQVSIIKGNKSAGFYTPQFIMQSKDATSPDAGLWFNIFTSGSTFIKTSGSGAATLSLEAQSSVYNTCGDDSSFGFIWWKGTFATNTQEMVAKLHSTGQFVLAETTGGVANSAGYGQLYVKNESPNELYFRNDNNDVIQITSGSGLAGSGGGDITSVVAGVGLSGGGTSSDVTLTLDMSELTDMTASVNSSEDELIILDNGADRRKLISEIPLSAFNNDSGFVTATLTDEQVQDKVGAMFSSNTETLITATYQDGDGTVDLVVDNDLSNYDNSSSGFITATLTTEQVQDIVGAMFSSNTETRISATYQDGDGTIDLAVDDMTADTNTNQLTTFTVSATTDSNATTISQGDDLMFAAGTGITCETTADGTVTITNTVTNTDTQLSTEQVQDIVGAMFTSNTETNTAVTYQDGDGTIDVVTTLDGAPLTTEAVQDIVGAMFTSNTETRVAATYQDSDGTIDLAVDDMTANDNTQNTTTLSFVDSSDDIILRNTTGGAGSGTDDIKFVAGSNITLTHTDADNITIASSGGGGASALNDLSDVTYSSGDLTISSLDKIISGSLDFDSSGHINFDGCAAGFTRTTYADATNVTVDFRTGNKAHLDMTGGSITGTLTMQFPAVSGNFVLVVQQDGSTRTINAYATKDSAGNAGSNDGGSAGAVRWSGGSVPDLTDGGNKRDILSFYWDATEEVCYGVASLNF